LYNNSKKIRNSISFYQFVLPALLAYTLFFLIPLIGGLIFSFTDWNGISKELNFVGLKNYISIFTEDSRFVSSLMTTLKLTISFVIIVNVLALFVAILLDTDLIKSKKRKHFYRGIVFVPHSISLIIVAFIWQFTFTKVYSNLVNELGLTFLDISWFQNGSTALVTVLIAMIWQSIGYYMVVYIAGLQTIDPNLVEAAELDGATGIKKLVYLTLPLIVPSMVVNLFVSITTGFKSFDIVFQMTLGGPNNATNVVALNIYQEAFLTQKLGYGSAKAIILCIVVIILTYFQLKFFKSREVEM
jgi:raffinose/stachyose/melibiose transport system permease protein